MNCKSISLVGDLLLMNAHHLYSIQVNVILRDILIFKMVKEKVYSGFQLLSALLTPLLFCIFVYRNLYSSITHGRYYNITTTCDLFTRKPHYLPYHIQHFQETARKFPSLFLQTIILFLLFVRLHDSLVNQKLLFILKRN